VRHESGISAIKSGADTSVVRASVRLRYRTGLNAGMRVVFGTQVFAVNAVIPDPRKVSVDLVCEAINVAT
jgi:head-tail adaptor